MKIGEYIQFVKQADIIEGVNPFSEKTNNTQNITLPKIYPNTFIPHATATPSLKVSDSFHVEQKPPKLISSIPPEEVCNKALVDAFVNIFPGNNYEERFTNFKNAWQGRGDLPRMTSISDGMQVSRDFDMARQLTWSPNNSNTFNSVLREIPLSVTTGPNSVDLGDMGRNPRQAFTLNDALLHNPEWHRGVMLNRHPEVQLNNRTRNIATAGHELNHITQITPDNLREVGYSGRFFQLPDEHIATGNYLKALEEHPVLRQYPEIQQRLINQAKLTLFPALETYYSYIPNTGGYLLPGNLPFFNPKDIDKFVYSPEFRELFEEYTGESMPELMTSKNQSTEWQQKTPRQKRMDIRGANWDKFNKMVSQISDVSPKALAENEDLLTLLEQINPAQQTIEHAWYRNPHMTADAMMHYADPRLFRQLVEVCAEKGIPLPQNLSQLTFPKAEYSSRFVYPAIITNGYKPQPGMPFGYNQVNNIKNLYNPTPIELSQLPNLYTTEEVPWIEGAIRSIGDKLTSDPSIKFQLEDRYLRKYSLDNVRTKLNVDKLAESAGKVLNFKNLLRTGEKMLGPAFAIYEGLGDTNNVTNAFNNWVQEQAKDNGISPEWSTYSGDSAQGFIYPWVATASGLNRAPQVAADFTVAAPTDLMNLTTDGINNLTGSNYSYLPRPETEKLTFTNVASNPGQFIKDTAKAIYTGIENIRPQARVEYYPEVQYPDGIDPDNEEDMELFNNMNKAQTEGLHHGLDYMYMPDKQRIQLYDKYEKERDYYADIVKQEKKTLDEARAKGRSGIETVEQWYTRDRAILDKIEMEMSALREVSPGVQLAQYVLNYGVPLSAENLPQYVPPIVETSKGISADIQQRVDEVNNFTPQINREAINQEIDTILEEDEDPYAWMPKRM